jgi:hypothetical protein
MNIRDLPVYSKHFGANEPEDHARISIEYVREVLQGLLWEERQKNVFLHDLVVQYLENIRQLI